ncbi:hypothetical protein PR202_ga27719 [Eleusine coracana subsp. coracana]|uniref:Uncharacterized protein n=1 Tax=Eleusine coracana subsp. coracana TaxID=191504 RepID=A0AAV5DGY1_ELECO|nr:hypothetical protein QOZ80_8AG0623660 [Eleusine coracana subsp. coracana]GJN09691.1 hypothetical protein PR202_ga27719 [Eleusine coracana subsp. coracana]
MGPSVAVSSIAAYKQHHHYASSTDEEEEDDEFEFKPLLPQQPGRTDRPGTGDRRVAAHPCKVVTHQPPSSFPPVRRAPNVAAAATARSEQQAAQPLQPRRVRWHHMAFGSVRVPSAMDMGEIRRRLKARQALAGSANEPLTRWAPWRLLRSLSCKGVEAVAVAAAAAPVRLL